jgi:hypothetical protein
MSTDIATVNGTRSIAAIVEKALIEGDLSKLTPGERVTHYMGICDSLGLNARTRPFLYLALDGGLTLYATRGATDQLRKLHGVSIRIIGRERNDDLSVVTAEATDEHGRTDESIGAVPIAGLKGVALANALMKAETKAKRRVTLSIVGLGFLDESELDTVQGKRIDVDPETGEIIEQKQEGKKVVRTTLDAARDKYTERLAEAGKLGGIDGLPLDQGWAYEEIVKHGSELREMIDIRKGELAEAGK